METSSPTVAQIPSKYAAGARLVRFVAENESNCQRAHIGCVLMDYEGHILATAANGSLYPRCCQRPDEMGNCGCLHAEVRAVIAQYNATTPRIAVVSISPCERCAKVLVEAGVHEVFYFQPSRVHDEGRFVLQMANVALTQIGEE